MKILCLSLWRNSWIPYWEKFLNDRGHEVRWHVGEKIKFADVKENVGWADAVLCHWATGWAIELSNIGINKPLFVIHRSYEAFMDVSLSVYDYVNKNKWENVTRLFMLNEAHYPVFKKACPECKLVPVFIKNGVDLSFFPLIDRGVESAHNIAWIANLNHKKGEMLAAHAVAQIAAYDRLVQLHHLGKSCSTRIALYLDNILPHLGTTWESSGWLNGHQHVRDFLKDKKYILSCSLVEGHPMNVIEAMATGCKPLIHRYPGIEYQFPEEFVWTTFDDLENRYLEKSDPARYRAFIGENYDYRKCYVPVAQAIEEYA